MGFIATWLFNAIVVVQHRVKSETNLEYFDPVTWFSGDSIPLNSLGWHIPFLDVILLVMLSAVRFIHHAGD